MKRHIGRNEMNLKRAATTVLFLLVSAWGQTAQGNTVTPAGASPDGPLTNGASSAAHGPAHTARPGMLVRISEIEIHVEHLDAYKAILKEEAAASVRLEPGVIAIFPMYQKERPTEVRILEIYASREAYESHLKTPHFQKYKTTTLAMVKTLRLVDMEAMDAEAMTEIFSKVKTG